MGALGHNGRADCDDEDALEELRCRYPEYAVPQWSDGVLSRCLWHSEALNLRWEAVKAFVSQKGYELFFVSFDQKFFEIRNLWNFSAAHMMAGASISIVA